MITLLDSEPDPASERLRAAVAADGHADIIYALRNGKLVQSAAERLAAAREGRVPWISTLTTAELQITRSHGIKPIATVSATCWLQCDYSPTEGHIEGWETALCRLGEEAKAAGANAVLDVKMRTIPLKIHNCMDFTLVGTAVKVEGLPPSADPIIATVPALEFVRLLEANIVPTGIAVGAHCRWMSDTQLQADFGRLGTLDFECRILSRILNEARKQAQEVLKTRALKQGNGVLAHVHISDVFEVEPGCLTDSAAEPISKLRTWTEHITDAFADALIEFGEASAEEKEAPALSLGLSAQRKQRNALKAAPQRFLARCVVVATTVDVPQGREGGMVPQDFQIVVDLHAGKTPLKGNSKHHQTYALNDQEGAI